MNHKCCGLLAWLAAFALSVAGAVVCHGNEGVPEPFGPQAVWTLPRKALSACLKKSPAPDACLTQVMRQTGASRQALAFTAQLDGEGYMVAFQALGRVNMATVEFPLRANTNQAVVLVGGTPPLVSSELTDAAIDIRQDPAYPALRQRYPNLELWPAGAVFRDQKPLPGGGQSFTFSYPLLNGCHACEVAGQALISLDFGPDGAYLGPRLIRLEPKR